MSVILSLGSNSGDRRAQLEAAITALGRQRIRVLRVSPVVETPAMLPPDAPSDWNRPFLNLAVECATDADPPGLLTAVKAVERTLGREPAPRWSPRPIDIDIVLFDDRIVDEPDLRIPHPGLAERSFVLAPLAAIAPHRVIPRDRRSANAGAGGGMTALAAYRRLGRPAPLWMGIVNLTPDSFSDGGVHMEWPATGATIEAMAAASAAAIDFGAESTRPGAEPLSAEDEWTRLAPNLERALAAFAGRHVRPAISVDTYHAATARRALDLGADVINDVGGLTDPAMIAVAQDSAADWIAMHQLSLPADPRNTLPADRPAVDQVTEWLDGRLDEWDRAGLDLARIVFDPGIGFGKTALQSQELLRGIDRFVRDDIRLLVGHSRKSFLRTISAGDAAGRDLPTIGASLELARRGVDILRVHNVPDHVAAWAGYAHTQPD